jgi:hypothetical protein
VIGRSIAPEYALQIFQHDLENTLRDFIMRSIGLTISAREKRANGRLKTAREEERH